MNSFRSYLAIRIVGVVVLGSIAAATVYNLDTAALNAPAEQEQAPTILSWDEMDIKGETSPVKYDDGTADDLPVVALEVLTDSGTPVTYVYAQCETEDSPSDGCIWLADKRGNGLGKSFVNHGGVRYYAR